MSEDPFFQEAKLEKLIHDQLQQLPLRRAPASLAPRILREIAKRARKPWWQKTWFDWPLICQVLSAIFFFSGLSAGAYWIARWIEPAQTAALGWFNQSFGWLDFIVRVPAIALSSLHMPGGKLLLPLLPYL